MKRMTLFIIIFYFGTALYAQTPQGIKYQAVVRDQAGGIIANKPVFFKISILSGSAAGPVVYKENHLDRATNAFGLADLQIGKGASELGTFSAINWGSGSYFIKVEIFPSGASGWQEMGTMQLLSVPYALYAKDVENKNDADADTVNEIQSLSVSGSSISLSKGGGTVAVPGDNWGTQVAKTNATLTGQGTDANPLDVVGAEIKPVWANILNKPAGFADGVDNVNDADTSVTNEIQTLSLAGNNLGISGGNTVVLPVSPGDNWGTQVVKTNTSLTGQGTGASPLGVVSSEIQPDWSNVMNKPAGFADGIDNTADADTSSTNEIQVLSKSGNTVTLSKNGGSFTDAVEDADASPVNEIQKLSISGTTLTLDNGGGSVTLPSSVGGDNWGNQVVRTNPTLTGQGTDASLLGVDNSAIQPLWSKIQSIPAGFADGTDNINYADTSSTNELQTLNLSGTQLTLSQGGGTVTLPSSGGGDNWGTQVVKANNTLTGKGTDADLLGVNSTMLTPSWSNVQNVPPGFADAVDNVDDADNNSFNEIQTLSIFGSNLSLSKEGGTVALPGDNWGIQSALTDATLSGNGTTGSPLKLAGQGAANGQVLKFNGTTWAPGVDLTGAGPTLPGGVPGNIQFNNSGAFGGDTSLTWDHTNKRLGIGTKSPEYPLHLQTDQVNGIYSLSSSPNGHAVVGIADATTGVTLGLYGLSAADRGYGVYGIASATSGPARGVYGISSSNLGHGVFGGATATSGSNYGVRGETASTQGSGVYGKAASTSGTNYGVRGETESPDGYSGYFNGGKFYVEGNVGIGKINPATKLDVVGNTGITGTLSVNGSVRGGGYIQNSASLNGFSLELGGPDPSGTNGQATIYLHHHDRMAHQLRYTLGTLYLEGAGNGYGTTSTPSLQVDGGLFAAVKGGNVGIGTNTPVSKLDVKGEVNLNSNKIINVANPVNAQDAATKAYVDAAGGIGGSGTLNYFPVFTAARTLGNSTIRYSSDGLVGIGEDPAGQNSRLLVQNMTYAGGATLSFLALFRTRTATLPPTITNQAYITSNGDAYFNGTVSTGKSVSISENLYIGNSVRIGDINSTSISGFAESRGTVLYDNNNFTMAGYPSGYNKDNTRVLSVEIKDNSGRWEYSSKSVALDNNYLIVWDTSNYKGHDYRLTLMRVE